MNASDCWSTAYKLIESGNIAGAMALCEKAPCSAVPQCQRFLGWEYYKQNEMQNALLWFGRAADQQDGEALFGIGSVHVARKEFQAAIPYFELAAKHGYPRGYQWIAAIYQHGSGVPTDLQMALDYYQRGASHGCIMAERSLIALESRQGNILVKFSSLFKLIRLQIKTVKIASHNKNDPRIADIPNAFAKTSR
jgi:TPR repeat protein